MSFEFIKEELTEARLLRNDKNLPKTDETLARSLFTHVLTLEILRHQDPKMARNYAANTLKYQFDQIRTGATDLHNQVAVLNNKDDYKNSIEFSGSSTVPLLQFKAYLRNVKNEKYDVGFTRQILYKLQKFLDIGDAQLIAARRAVQDWPGLNKNEQQGTLAILKRNYNLHSRRSDMIDAFNKVSKGAGLNDKNGTKLATKAALAFGAGYALGRILN